MRVEFKFHESVPQSQRQRLVTSISKLGAKKVGPLFPDESDPELASLYKADGVPASKAERLISKLDAQPTVEFADRTPERKLIR
jgi:hypothetical protein